MFIAFSNDFVISSIVFIDESQLVVFWDKTEESLVDSTSWNKLKGKFLDG